MQTISGGQLPALPCTVSTEKFSNFGKFWQHFIWWDVYVGFENPKQISPETGFCIRHVKNLSKTLTFSKCQMSIPSNTNYYLKINYLYYTRMQCHQPQIQYNFRSITTTGVYFVVSRCTPPAHKRKHLISKICLHNWPPLQHCAIFALWEKNYLIILIEWHSLRINGNHKSITHNDCW